MKSLKPFKSFEDYWPSYMEQHANLNNRRLHFVGTFIVHLILLYVLATTNFKILLAIPFVGYGFAWYGHFVIEKNRPATFEHPIWSLMGDFRMFYLILLKKQ